MKLRQKSHRKRDINIPFSVTFFRLVLVRIFLGLELSGVKGSWEDGMGFANLQNRFRHQGLAGEG